MENQQSQTNSGKGNDGGMADRQPEIQRRADDEIAADREAANAALKASSGEDLNPPTSRIQRARDETDRSMMAERKNADATAERSSQRLADEISAHEKTKIALTTRDEFLAIVSHDLRNPIGAISTCASMLLEDSLYHSMNPEIRHWIGFMKRNADSALNMIRDLMDVEQLAVGKLDLNIGRHDVNSIVREAVENVIQIAAAKNILLRAVEAPGQAYADCDRERVLQIMSNLIGNALKFTPGQGTIVVRVIVKAEEVEVSVTDAGPGIPTEKQEEIFERFAQLGAKDRQGLGLGLHISKMLVQLHGGRIWLKSEPGKGSSFYFTLSHSSQNPGLPH